MKSSCLLLALIFPSILVSWQLTDTQRKSIVFEAKLISNEPYEVCVNPIPIQLSFSDNVIKIDESDLITDNCYVSSFHQLSTTEYHFTVTPFKPGEVSVSLSKFIQSESQSILQSIPSLSFHYAGVTILSQQVNVTETEGHFVLTTNQPGSFYSLVSTNHYLPSSKDIMNRGSRLRMIDSTTYSFDLYSLKPGTVYYVFTTGKESSGTLIEQVSFSFRTKGEEGKGSCPTGLVLNTQGDMIEAICSDHGTCEDSQCSCEQGFIGEVCDKIESSEFNYPTSSTHFLHGQYRLTIEVPSTTELYSYIKNSIQEGLSSYCGLPIMQLLIRQYTILDSSLPINHSSHIKKASIKSSGWSEVFLQFTLAVDKENSLLYKALLENEQVIPEMEAFLQQKGIVMKSLERQRVTLQTTEDLWSCHNGVKDGDEGDTDCGGMCIKKCAQQHTCRNSNDCDSNLQCNHSQCEKERSFTNHSIIAAVGILCVAICLFLIVGTFINHNENGSYSHFEHLKENNV